MSLGTFVKKASDFEIMLAMIARGEIKGQDDFKKFAEERGWDVEETRAKLTEACTGDYCYLLYTVVSMIANTDIRRKLRAYQKTALAKFGIEPRSREHFVFHMGAISKEMANDPETKHFDYILHCNFDDRLDHFFNLGLNL